MPASYTLYCLGQRLALTLPLGMAYWLAHRLADAQYTWSQDDRRTIVANLTAVVGDKRAARRLARQVFRNFGMYLVDFLRCAQLTETDIRDNVQVEGLDVVRQVLAQHRGMISVTAHLGNWELAGAVTARLGLPVAAVALNHQDSRVNNFFVRQRRQQGVASIPPGMALRHCHRFLEQGHIVALLGDRNYTSQGVRCTLLGRMVEIPRGPALLSLRTGIPIVPGFLTRESDGPRYALRFAAPIIPPASPADREAAIQQISQQYVNVIEQFVRRYPTQWFLFRRFDVPEPATA